MGRVDFRWARAFAILLFIFGARLRRAPVPLFRQHYFRGSMTLSLSFLDGISFCRALIFDAELMRFVCCLQLLVFSINDVLSHDIIY